MSCALPGPGASHAHIFNGQQLCLSLLGIRIQTRRWHSRCISGVFLVRHRVPWKVSWIVRGESHWTNSFHNHNNKIIPNYMLDIDIDASFFGDPLLYQRGNTFMRMLKQCMNFHARNEILAWKSCSSLPEGNYAWAEVWWMHSTLCAVFARAQHFVVFGPCPTTFMSVLDPTFFTLRDFVLRLLLHIVTTHPLIIITSYWNKSLWIFHSDIMIKPDGVQRGLIGEIIKRFEQKGERNNPL